MSLANHLCLWLKNHVRAAVSAQLTSGHYKLSQPQAAHKHEPLNCSCSAGGCLHAPCNTCISGSVTGPCRAHKQSSSSKKRNCSNPERCMPCNIHTCADEVANITPRTQHACFARGPVSPGNSGKPTQTAGLQLCYQKHYDDTCSLQRVGPWSMTAPCTVG